MIFAASVTAAGTVTRPDDHREDEFVRAVLVLQRLDVADLYDDLLAGHDVGDRLREDVRPLLVEQARGLVPRLRRLVDLPRLSRR